MRVIHSIERLYMAVPEESPEGMSTGCCLVLKITFDDDSCSVIKCFRSPELNYAEREVNERIIMESCRELESTVHIDQELPFSMDPMIFQRTDPSRSLTSDAAASSEGKYSEEIISSDAKEHRIERSSETTDGSSCWSFFKPLCCSSSNTSLTDTDSRLSRSFSADSDEAKKFIVSSDPTNFSNPVTAKFIKRDGTSITLSCIMMEYGGIDLQTIFNNPDISLDFDTRYKIFQKIISAVLELHALGIIHRDIKPGNIFIPLSPDGTLNIDALKIGDFGSAKSLLSPRETTTTVEVSQDKRAREKLRLLNRSIDSRSPRYSGIMFSHETKARLTGFSEDMIACGKLALSLFNSEHKSPRFHDNLENVCQAVADMVLQYDTDTTHTKDQVLEYLMKQYYNQKSVLLAERINFDGFFNDGTESLLPKFDEELTLNPRLRAVAMSTILMIFPFGPDNFNIHVRALSTSKKPSLGQGSKETSCCCFPRLSGKKPPPRRPPQFTPRNRPLINLFRVDRDLAEHRLEARITGQKYSNT